MINISNFAAQNSGKHFSQVPKILAKQQSMSMPKQAI
jgi:hypothetical protein